MPPSLQAWRTVAGVVGSRSVKPAASAPPSPAGASDPPRHSGNGAAPVDHSVSRLSALSFAAAGLDRVLGIILLAVVAAIFGASTDSDIYFLALTVPVALGNGLAEALYTTFVPRFSAAGEERPTLAQAVRFSTWMSLGLTSIFVVAVLVSEPRRLGIWLILACIVPALGVAGVSSAALVARRRYVAAVARVPLATAMALVISCVTLPFVRSPLVLAVAMATGYVGALVFLLLIARHDSEARSRGDLPSLVVARAAGSVFLAVLIGGPLVVVVERAFASGLPAGSITLLTFARNLVLLPMLLSNALASGMFPAATARRELSDYAGLSRLVLTTLRVAVLVNLCMGALLVVCRHDVVRVALQRGAFTAADAGAVAKLMLIFVGSIVGLALTTVATRGLFAIGRYRLVAVLSVISFGLYLLLAAILRSGYGRDGLALAFLVSALSGGAAAVIFLVREFSVPLRRFAANAMLKPGLLACVFTGGAFIGATLMPIANTSLLLSASRLVISACCGVVALGGAILLFRTEDYHLALRTVNRLRRPRARGVAS